MKEALVVHTIYHYHDRHNNNNNYNYNYDDYQPSIFQSHTSKKDDFITENNAVTISWISSLAGGSSSCGIKSVIVRSKEVCDSVSTNGNLFTITYIIIRIISIKCENFEHIK